eukprot:463793-Amorphochlora_amoeboformis.AAC.1
MQGTLLESVSEIFPGEFHGDYLRYFHRKREIFNRDAKNFARGDISVRVFRHLIEIDYYSEISCGELPDNRSGQIFRRKIVSKLSTTFNSE